MALSPTGKRISNLRDLDLDAGALEPGQVLDTGSDRATAGLPDNGRPERPDLPPGVSIEVAQRGRRISPLVTGRRAMPTGDVQRVDDGELSPPGLRVAPRPTAPVAPKPMSPAKPGLIAAPAKKRNAVGTLVVQLGRYGDIINILPLLAEEARVTKHRIPLMVAEEFASLLEGVSYVKPVIFKGTYHELDRAWKQALTIDPAARCSQVHVPGKDFPRKENSFARDSWKRIGAGNRWEQVPLFFDRRDREREEMLAGGYDWSKRTVLLNLGANSFPFPHDARVRDALAEHARKNDYLVYDISELKADRIYDLLGLFDRANLLITADTATQHLANASSIPVIAFRVSEPWFGSPKRANHILNRRYSDIDMREVLSFVEKALAQPKGSIVHVYPGDESGEEMSSRVQIAQGSWDIELLNSLPVKVSDFPRNSRTKLQDPQPTMYMLDIIEAALNKTKLPDDIVLFTNSDVGFSDTAVRDVQRLCMLKGACYGYRFDHVSIETPLDHLATVSAPCNGGLDLFAFTRRWLTANAWRLPDMLLGRTGWDLVYRNIVKQTGGGEVYGAVWHENHVSWWKQNFQTPGNTHNTNHLKRYREMNDITRPLEP